MGNGCIESIFAILLSVRSKNYNLNLINGCGKYQSVHNIIQSADSLTFTLKVERMKNYFSNNVQFLVQVVLIIVNLITMN